MKLNGYKSSRRKEKKRLLYSLIICNIFAP
nr:MAG TPA: hypothetical protein [Caudoviricetes sp.]